MLIRFADGRAVAAAGRRERLERSPGPLDCDGIEVIDMDEYAIQKGHRHAAVLVEPTRKRVLWVARSGPRGHRPGAG